MNLWYQPPPDKSQLPIIQQLTDLYRDLYTISRRIHRRDRFGIHLDIEKICMDAIRLAIAAALEEKNLKLKKLKALRVQIAVLKQFIRVEYELKIIQGKTYVRLQQQLQEISKMAHGWVAFIQKEMRSASLFGKLRNAHGCCRCDRRDCTSSRSSCDSSDSS